MTTPIMSGRDDCFPKFDTSSAGLSERWKRWLRAFERFAEGKGVTDACQIRALLLDKGGMDLQDLFFDLEIADGADEYLKCKNTLNKHFVPESNAIYERHVFHEMRQKESETVDQYITRLRHHALICDFGDNPALDERIRDQVLAGLLSSQLRRKLLGKGNTLTLKQVRDCARIYEDSEKQSKAMEGTKTEVNKLSTGNRFRGRGKITPATSTSSRSKCYRCGYEGHCQNDPICAARGKRCRRCNGPDHFESCCRTKMNERPNFRGRGFSRSVHRGRGRGRGRSSAVRHVEEQDDTHVDEYAFSLAGGEYQDSEEDTRIEIEVGGVPLQMLIDSGTTCNVVDRDTWERLKQEHIQCKSSKQVKKLFPYGSSKSLFTAGSFTANVKVRDRLVEEVSSVVVEENGSPLLGRKTAQLLGVLKLGLDVHAVTAEETDMTTKEIQTEFADVFTGFGKLQDFQLKIPVDSDIEPVIQPTRRVPFHLREKLEKKLDELEKLDIIEKVNEPSAWVSPIVVVPKKNNDIRICVDMRMANRSVLRTRHPIPTIDEILQDLNQSKIFSRLDIRWAYHQIELMEESRGITTFTTHKGLYRYKRLVFGISCAPEMYQKVLQQVLQGCDVAHHIMDDIIIHGKTMEEHDMRLRKVLETIRQKGMTLNPDKCLFKMQKLEFMGHVLSEKGIGPTNTKVAAVQEAKEPTCASEVRSFLGLVNFVGRFIQNLATLSEPLRQLTRKSVPFKWGPEQQKSFDTLKERLASAEMLAYFDKEAKTHVITDASPVGLGAVLLQEQEGEYRVISYASRSLTDVERRYSTTEKEALAIVWACERFHVYIYGADFELWTDHKPLQFIYAERSKPCARIERWVLRMQPYKYTIRYIKGQNNIADCLSRLMKKTDGKDHEEIEEYVRNVAMEATPVAMTTREIERKSDKDPELEEVRKCLLTGSWYSIGYKQYAPIKHELSAIGKLVLRGTRIVIPQSLREQALELAHEGHPGMKQRLRSKVWWPGMDRAVEEFCKTCYGCQLVSQPTPPTPMHRTTLPSSPWQHLAADLLGPLPSGEYICVLVDYYSRYYEIEITKDTSAGKIVKILDNIFLTHGLPESVQTDNGPQFVSQVFEEFFRINGISHRKTTPLLPQANGKVERQNRSLLKRLKIAQAEKKDCKSELKKYLTMYRNTPHTVTGKSPAEMLFRRTLRTKLPDIQQYVEDWEVRDRDSDQKGKGKEYADNKRRAKESDIQEGDSVLMKQNKENKLSTTFKPTPYNVVDRSGNSVVIESDGQTFKRNITSVKKFQTRNRKSSIPEQSEPLNEQDIEVTETDQTDDSRDVTPSVLDKEIRVETPPSPKPSPRLQRERRMPVKYNDFVVGAVFQNK